MSYSYWDWDMIFCYGLIGGLVLALFGALGALGFDQLQDRRSFAASVACEAKRMQPRRQSFSSTVVCVPAITRQDTTTISVR